MSKNDGESHIGASYDPETGTYHALYQPGEPGSLAGAVVYLVSVATGNAPNAMAPLYETVDADVLESLLGSGAGQTARIEFRYCGCEVTAKSDGEVVVTCPEDAE